MLHGYTSKTKTYRFRLTKPMLMTWAFLSQAVNVLLTISRCYQAFACHDTRHYEIYAFNDIIKTIVKPSLSIQTTR